MEVQRSKAANAQSNEGQESELPQCKIKRNYSCNHCSYFTQNPRFHLSHLRDVHGERIAINKCNLCLYASRHFQKLVRHMKMVHGSAESITGQARKRAIIEETAGVTKEQEDCVTPALGSLEDSVEHIAQNVDLSSALEESRGILKDLAVLYFAEEEVKTIMSDMEAADEVLLAEIAMEDLSITMEQKAPVRSFFEEVKKESIHESDLKCPCGHVSKCLSETFVHRKACNRTKEGSFGQSLGESGSAKCQHCKQAVEDPNNHHLNCPQYGTFQKEKARTSSQFDSERNEIGGGFLDKSEEEIEGKAETKFETISDDVSAIETVTSQLLEADKQVKAGGTLLKKVFKCPRCPFWASTASRFHVHIVGHLNKKPFKCSLCTYRSNWRWDITKHIRMKGTRNPCHKNARVLMNDDAGRRNYTKYNKYLTVTKVNDEDGDSKGLKTGEMTDEHREVPLPETTESTEDEKKQAKEADKRTGYKCHKCPYRHDSRDAVLVHARIYHLQDSQSLLHRQATERERNFKPPGSNMNKVFAAAISLKQKQSVQEAKRLTDNNIHQTDFFKNSKDRKNGPNRSGAITDIQSSTAPPACSEDSPESKPKCLADPKVSQMLREVITSPNFCKEVPERKGPSPFRCGHCHQVSNWKHVIQRHCRLKHSGNIQIEALNRSRDVVKPTYQPIDFGQPRRSQEAHAVKTQATNPADKSNKQEVQTPHLPDSSASDTNFLMKRSECHQTSCKPNSSNKQINGPFTKNISKKTSALKPSSSEGKTGECAGDTKSENKFNTSAPNAKQRLKSPCQDFSKDSSPSKTNKFKPRDAVKDSNDASSIASNSTKVQSTSATKSGTSVEQCSRLSNILNCPYCPFKNECSKTFHQHLQRHINSQASHRCEHCDYSTSSISEFNEHTRVHFEFLNNKTSAAFFTSFDELKLKVVGGRTKNDPGQLKSASKKTEEDQKNKNEKFTTLRRSGCTATTRPVGRKSASFVAEHKTILVNPKTGQVIKRN